MVQFSNSPQFCGVSVSNNLPAGLPAETAATDTASASTASTKTPSGLDSDSQMKKNLETQKSPKISQGCF